MSTRTLDRPEAVAVDPRIAARRRSVEHEQRRRRGRRLLAVVVAATVVGGAWFATRTSLLDVDRLRVEGNARVGAEELVAASGVRPGDQLLDIDAGAVEARLEALPWIDTATVDRALGGTVTLTVTERTAVAAADGAGGRALVDATGRVLGPAPADPAATSDLVALEGPVAAEAGTELVGADAALELYALLGPGVRSRTAAVAVGADGSLELRLRPQGVARFGPPTRLEAKVGALTTTMGQVDQRDLAVISVIDPDTPVVDRTPV